MKKEETPITLLNGGMHSQRAYKRMKDMLLENEYKNPRLYHLILMGSEITEDYQQALKALVAELKRRRMPCQWKGCIEVEKDKGLHFHVFILVEAKHRNPCSVLNHNQQDWLNVTLLKRGLSFHIARPKSSIHWDKNGNQLNYATLAGEKLDDCLIWISYLAKKRSKPDDIEHIYFGSRPSRARPKPRQTTAEPQLLQSAIMHHEPLDQYSLSLAQWRPTQQSTRHSSRTYQHA